MAKRDMEEAETKRFIEQQKRKKLEEEMEKKRMLEQLARDKEERFGKKFDVNQQVKKEPTPIENVKYYTDAIIKLYPTFRCGTQSKDCLNLIKIAVGNILKNKDEEKFRKLKMTNPNVQERLVKIPLSLKLLKNLGFVESGEFNVLEKVDEALLKESFEYLEQALAKLNNN